MGEEALKALLQEVASGALDPLDAADRLRHLTLHDLGRAQLDTHRYLRQGFPEVVYGAGKCVEDILLIARAILDAGDPLIVTRIEASTARLLMDEYEGDLQYLRGASMLVSNDAWADPLGVQVLVLAAGTADLPVAEEAAAVAGLSGCAVAKLWDCGVAGIHRLTSQQAMLDAADLIIVVAGMEGALPSVVGGLVRAPLIAVPTSTGYGTGLGGYAAMLTMLNSCAAGTAVMNIDNGFGAGMFAGALARAMGRRG